MCLLSRAVANVSKSGKDQRSSALNALREVKKHLPEGSVHDAMPHCVYLEKFQS